MTILAATLALTGSDALADGAPLFPLRPGTRWVYTAGGGFTHEVRVLGPNKGGPGFEVFGYFGEFVPRTLLSVGQDTVVQVLPDGTEALYYMLDAPVGTSWVIDVPGGTCVDGATVTVGARDLTMTVPAGTFEGVVRLNYTTRCFDSGFRAEWFAPGVGLIQRTFLTFFGEVTINLLAVERDKDAE